jgi:hypothetical protein
MDIRKTFGDDIGDPGYAKFKEYTWYESYTGSTTFRYIYVYIYIFIYVYLYVYIYDYI